MVNTKAIKIRMFEKDITTKMMAKELNLCPSTTSQKINGRRNMTLDEVGVFQRVLEIPDEQFGYYFLNRQSHKVT